MRNIGKQALSNARQIVNRYRDQNRRIYQEAKAAYNTIKATINAGCKYEFSEKQKYFFNGKEISQRLILRFTDSNGNDLDLSFREFIEIQVAEAFRNSFANV